MPGVTDLRDETLTQDEIDLIRDIGVAIDSDLAVGSRRIRAMSDVTNRARKLGPTGLRRAANPQEAAELQCRRRAAAALVEARRRRILDPLERARAKPTPESHGRQLIHANGTTRRAQAVVRGRRSAGDTGDGRPAHWIGPWPPTDQIEYRADKASPIGNVIVRRAAMEAIVEAWEGTSNEVGGWLLGKNWHAHHRTIEISEAAGPGNDAVATPTSLRPGVDALIEASEIQDVDARVFGTETLLLGFWHSHPGIGVVDLSDGDLDAISRQLCQMERMSQASDAGYVAVIVTPIADSNAPRLTAYVVRRTSTGSLVCESTSVEA
jgi:hypothetical protein